MIALRIIYILNIIVAGQIAFTSMFQAEKASATIFAGAYEHTDLVRLVGCLWLSIALISGLGLWKPITFSPILLVQLIYKGTWLFLVALPAFKANLPFPKGMASFFIIWVLVIPFIIPWKVWFAGS